jgi:hypothetical protein
MEGREHTKKIRFDKKWIKDDSFLGRIHKIWNQPIIAKDSIEILQIKLKKVRNDLKGWGTNVRGQEKKIKMELSQEWKNLEDLEEVSTLSNEQTMRKSKIQENLMQIWESREYYRHQRSSENWLLKEENNTEYFHRIASGQNRNKTIFSMQDGPVSYSRNPRST